MNQGCLDILLIEDSSFDVKWISKELNEGRLESTIARADSLAAAEEICSKAIRPFDIVILDLNLRDTMGLDTLRQWLSISGDTPIIVLTGECTDKWALDAAKLGAQDYLEKGRDIGPSLRKAIHFVVSRQRVTDTLMRNIEILSIAASLDPLTGISNRRTMFEKLEQLFGEFKESGTSFTCILADIDHFGEVNNTYGHPIGDEFLRRTAVSLVSRVRSQDVVCRYGGEEFCVLLPNTDERTGWRLGERLRCCVEEDRLMVEGKSVSITMSFGVACIQPNMSKVEDLVKVADDALYEAKHRSRNVVVAATESKPLESIISR